MQIPKAKPVDRALKNVIDSSRVALQALNQKAGTLMTRGKYGEAEAMATKGREIQAFIEEAMGLRERWKAVKGVGKAAKNEKTPLWAFYQPILSALVELEGTSTRAEFEPLVHQMMRGALKPGDYDVMAHGRERWQLMIRRARKPMIEEGWLENSSGSTWKITPAGRKAAAAEVPNGGFVIGKKAERR